MNKRLAGLAAFVSIVAIGAAVYFTRCRDGAPGTKPAPVAGSSDAATATPQPTRASAESDAPPIPQAPAMPEWERDNDPVGPLTLEGQVLGPGDAPVGGAIVVLSSAPERTATTEKDGSFSFDKLVGRTYFVSARSDDLVGGPVSHRLTAGSDPVVVRLRAGASLAVSVVAQDDGAPVARALVTLGDGRQSATTGADGVATFRGVSDGGLRVSASAAGFATAHQLVQVPHGTTTPVPVKIALPRGVPVSGRVVDEAGKPIKNAAVVAWNAAGLFQLAGAKDGVTSDAEGRFEIPAIAAGTWRFHATHPDHAPGTSRPVAVDAASSGVKDVEIVLATGGKLAGTVVDTAGAAVPFATVRVAVARTGLGDDGVEQSLRQVSADDRGVFRFDGLPRVAMRVLALGELGSSPAVEVDLDARPDTRGVVLTLSILGTISGIVVDAAGQPVAEAQVSAMPDFLAGGVAEELALRSIEAVTTDGGGRFVFTGLPDGTYFLRASRAGLGQGGRLFLTPGTRVQTGATDVRLELLADGGVRGKVAFDDGSAPPVFTVTVGFPPGTPFAGGGGAFEVGQLPPGTYDVHVRGPDFPDASVRAVVVEPGKTRDLGAITLKRGRAVSGRVTDGNGAPVAGALVIAGRQIIGDGTSLSADLGAGADEAFGLRRAFSGGDGAYRLSGLPDNELAIAAEHPSRGRSAGFRLPAGSASINLDFALVAFAAVEGTVIVGGRPAAQASVVASAKGGTADQFAVVQVTGGLFVIDKLPAGTYRLNAFVGGATNLGNQSGGVDVVLKPGERARVEIKIEIGDVTVIVTAKPKQGAQLDAFQAFLIPGVVSATNADELTQLVLGAADHKQALAVATESAKLTQVVPGSYTLCAIPITGNINDPAFGQRLQENLRSLKVYCQRAEIATAPLEQTITVELPGMDPLPAN